MNKIFGLQENELYIISYHKVVCMYKVIQKYLQWISVYILSGRLPPILIHPLLRPLYFTDGFTVAHEVSECDKITDRTLCVC